MWFYRLASNATGMAGRVLCRLSVVGRENVPAEGPLVVVANHLSLVDPPLLGASFPRTVRFMAKEELFRVPGLSWVVSNYLAFPVRRGEADRQALRTALNLLKQGEVLGIFPEGTRSRDAQMARAHAGAALIAVKSGAPVVPVGITGSEQILRFPRPVLRPRVIVRIGRPFVLESQGRSGAHETLLEQADFLMCKVAELLPTSYRGVYADRLAGDELKSGT